MTRTRSKKREEARRLYLTGEVSTNSEIAARLKVKPHTIDRWRKEEDWDSLRTKIDIRAAELFIEKIATERVTLNVRHYRFWELLLAKLAEDLKGQKSFDIRELDRIAGILDKAQKGQRLAKGLSATGETEEAIRAQSEVEMRRMIDAFIDSVKEHVPDEESRDRSRQSIIASLPEEADAGAGQSSNQVA